MKTKFKIKYIFIVIAFFAFALSKNVYAAGSFSVSASKTSLNSGGTSTITIKTTNCAGKFSITSSNTSVVTVSTSSTWIDGTTTITAIAKANGTARVTVTPLDVTDNDLNDITGSKSVTISVTTPAPAPSTNTSTNTTTNKNTNTTTKTTTTTTLSNNAFLSQFRVDRPGITPAFSKTIYNYAITVGEDVDKLNVTAVPEDSKAIVNVSGNTSLKIGDNTITVRVTAQDKKTVRTYKIIVTKTDDPVKSNAYLQNLIITNATLSPAFSSEVFEYECGSVKSDVDKLDISVFPVNEKAKVTIEGNDKLVTGENVIKITVTSENSKMQKVYTIKVNKEENIIENINTKDEQNTKNQTLEESSLKMTIGAAKEILKEKAAILLLYAFVWIEFLQVVYLYEKLKKSNNITIK